MRSTQLPHPVCAPRNRERDRCAHSTISLNCFNASTLYGPGGSGCDVGHPAQKICAQPSPDATTFERDMGEASRSGRPFLAQLAKMRWVGNEGNRAKDSIRAFEVLDLSTDTPHRPQGRNELCSTAAAALIPLSHTDDEHNIATQTRISGSSDINERILRMRSPLGRRGLPRLPLPVREMNRMSHTSRPDPFLALAREGKITVTYRARHSCIVSCALPCNE